MVRFVRWFAPHTLMIVGLVLVSVGFWMILLFRHDLTVAAVVVSFIVLGDRRGHLADHHQRHHRRVGPAEKSGAASAVSETAYELGAVVGTATLGTIFTAFYRANVERSRRPRRRADRRRRREHRRRDSGGTRRCPPARPTRLLDSARTAFDSGIAPTAIIAAAADPDRGRRRRADVLPATSAGWRRPISISADPTSGATVRTWFHAVHGTEVGPPLRRSASAADRRGRIDRGRVDRSAAR